MRPARIALGCGAFLAVLVALFVVLARPSLWEYQRAGSIELRLNRLNGRVEIRKNGTWTAPAEPREENAAPDAAALARVRVQSFAWTPSGLLAGQVYNGSDRDIVGRVAFRLDIREKSGARVKERILNRWVLWPARSSSDFALRTNLTTPDADQRTAVVVQPVF